MHVLIDITSALRRLIKPRLITFVSAIVLALCIAANLTAFNLIDAVILRKLPVTAPDGLLLLQWHSTREVPYALRRASMGYDIESAFPFRLFDAVRQNCNSCSQVFASAPLGVGPSGVQAIAGGKTFQVVGEAVSDRYFVDLGVHPVVGRLFTEEEEQTRTQLLIIISYGLWSSVFARDDHVIGTTVYLNHTPYTVVGIAPPAFDGIQPGRHTAFWVPIAEWPEIASRKGSDDLWWLTIMVRLKPRTQLSYAQTELDHMFQLMLSAIEPQYSASKVDLHLRVVNGSKGLSTLRDELAPYLYALGGVTAVSLVSGCINVILLMLTRTADTRHEWAVRIAMGAGPTRLFCQSLFDGLALASAAGLLGVLLAYFCTTIAFTLTSRLTFRLGLAVDRAPVTGNGIGLCIVLIVAIGTAVGLVPTLYRRGLDPINMLKQSDRTLVNPSRIGSASVGDILLSGQVAVCLLVIVSALSFRTVVNRLNGYSLGFNPHNVLLLSINPASGKEGYDDSADRRLVETYVAIQRRIEALPGVVSTSGSTLTPMASWDMAFPIVPRATSVVSRPVDVPVNFVAPRFFDTMRIRVRAGRDFTDSDLHSRAELAIVNAECAKRLFGDENAIGRQFGFADAVFSIVGVVDNAKYRMVTETPEPRIYFPYSRFIAITANSPSGWNIEIKTLGAPSRVAASVRKAIEEIYPGLLPFNVRTQDEQIAEGVIEQEVLSVIASGLGFLSLLLSCTVFYASLAHSLRQRRRELAIRVSLGAHTAHIWWVMLRHNLVLLGSGIAVGALAAVAFTRAVTSLLYGPLHIAPILVWSALAMFGATLLASLLALASTTQLQPATLLKTQ